MKSMSSTIESCNKIQPTKKQLSCKVTSKENVNGNSSTNRDSLQKCLMYKLLKQKINVMTKKAMEKDNEKGSNAIKAKNFTDTLAL